MNVFKSLDREQADMYRWMRRRISPSMFAHLTGRKDFHSLSQLQIDQALRDAHDRDVRRLTVDGLLESSKIRDGLLPPELGDALVEYTKAIVARIVHREGVGDKTEDDIRLELRKTFTNLCEEMAKLR